MRLSERTSRSSSGSDRSPRASVVMGITVSAGVYTLRGFRGSDAVEQTVRTEGRWRTTEHATGVWQDTSSKGETRLVERTLRGRRHRGKREAKLRSK